MKKSKIKQIAKKLTASILACTLICSGAGINKLSVIAANTKTYISEVKLITGDLTQAVKDKYKGYKFIEKSLSEGGGGTPMYMAYKTTTDPKEAIRDIAFMQMKGKYSISDYEKVLEDNMELAISTVEDYKSVVEEFRANYNSTNPDKKKLADQAYTLLNKYYEEDTGLHMGDFFLNADGKVTDENYATLCMQATSTTRYALLNILTKATDTDDNATWIDRLASYNGFEGFCQANGYDANDDSSRKQAMDQFDGLYADKIKYLTEDVETKKDGETVSICAWDDFAQKLKDNENKLVETTGEIIENATDNKETENADEAAEVMSEKIDDSQAFAYSAIYEVLSKVEYKDGTLYDLFTTPSSEMQPEDFYPIIGALSEGQQAIMIRNGFGILVSNIAEQIAASKNLDSVVDIDENVIEENMEVSAEELQENGSKAQENDVDQIIDEVCEEAEDDILENIIKDDAISVYAGVDRSFFEKGVAMTSEASSSDASDDSKWNVNRILDISGNISAIIGLSCLLAGGYVISAGHRAASAAIAQYAIDNAADIRYAEGLLNAGTDESLAFVEAGESSNSFAVENMNKLVSEADTAAQAASATYRIAGRVLIGIGLVLVTYSIVSVIIEAINKDKPKYTEIPKKMVDATNKDKTNMESFLYYDAALNDKDEAQDLNDWTSGMWLAMYTSKTKDAGGPILADSFKIQGDANNTAGMKSAHLFGETGAYNMLSYSKNSNSQPKLFMYFEKDEPSNAGSIFGKTTVLASTILIALAIVAITAILVYKRKKKNSDK